MNQGGGVAKSDAATATASTTSSTDTALVASSSASNNANSGPGVSSGQRQLIIASVLGGLTGVTLILVVALCLLRAKKNKIKEQKGLEAGRRATVESRTYTGLNESFAGITFHRSNHSQSENLLEMQSPGPVYSRRTPGDFGHPAHDGSIHSNASVYSITPEATVRRKHSDALLLPPYADEPMRTPNTPTCPSRTRSLSLREVYSPPEREISHFSIVSSRTIAHPTSPDLPELEAPVTEMYSRHRPARDTLDTMGFPVETDYQFDPKPTPYKDIPIASPVPRNTLLNQQDVLEHAVTDDLPPQSASSQPSTPTVLAIARSLRDSSQDLTPSPNLDLLPQPLSVNRSHPSSAVSRVLSPEMNLMRESPVLGTRGPPVRISPPSSTSLPAPQMGSRTAEIMRMASVRSNYRVHSMMPSIVSDSELERMGVGPRI